MQWVDIGANLVSRQFSSDLEAVMERAKGAGVTRMIVTGTDGPGSAASAELCRGREGLWSTAGVHPHHASDFTDATREELKALSERPEVVAIGECGLDFNRNFSPRDAQIRAFAHQLELGAETGLPLFLHQRDAHDTFFAMLREAWSSLPGGAVVHCFTEGPKEAAEYLELGCHVGITGWVADERRGAALRDAVLEIPTDRLMLETDAPYLMPRNIQPKPETRRNEPMNLPWVAREVAALRTESIEELSRSAWDATSTFFRLDEGA